MQNLQTMLSENIQFSISLLQEEAHSGANVNYFHQIEFKYGLKFFVLIMLIQYERNFE